MLSQSDGIGLREYILRNEDYKKLFAQTQRLPNSGCSGVRAESTDQEPKLPYLFFFCYFKRYSVHERVSSSKLKRNVRR